MVEITFKRDSRQRLSSLLATGHADSDTGSPEYDHVCAAVSAILQAAYAGLQEVAKLRFEGVRKPGDLQIQIPEPDRERLDVVAIVRTAEISLEQLARQYPKFVRVKRSLES